MKRSTFVVLVIGLFVLVGCGGTPLRAGRSLRLTQTLAITGFGFSIDYPEGWIAETRFSASAISETAGDHARFFSSNAPFVTGRQVTLDHRDMEFMNSIGLAEGATLDDLLVFNAEALGWHDVETTETEIFGVTAIRATVHTGNQHRLEYMGFMEDEVFLFGVAAPSQESLDEFIPTWEQMLDSIERIVQ